MRLSAKTEYACIAILELAANYGAPEPVRVRSIAHDHRVPSRFLVQILLQLKGVGLVASTRGAAGGYRLAKDPSAITLADVISVMEGPRNSSESEAVSRASAAAQALTGVYRQISEVERRMLSEVSFAELVARAAQGDREMYYI